MKFIGKLLGSIGIAIVYSCVGTTVAQGVGITTLWAKGAFTEVKVRKYAAAVYGFDLTTFDMKDGNSNDAKSDELMDENQRLAARVDANPTLAERRLAIKKGADNIRGLAQKLSTKRERHEIVKQGFDELLTSLEQDVQDTALDEVRRTLEVLKPRQTKDLLMDMLLDDPVTDDDDILADVLVIIRGMPPDKLKKIFGEFKTDAERSELHRVLVAIGEFDQR